MVSEDSSYGGGLFDRQDGSIMRNALAGLGGGRDVGTHDKVAVTCKELLSERELESLFATDGLAQKVVTHIPDKASTGPLTIKTKQPFDDTDIIRWLRDEGAIDALTEASKFANLYYGGAAVILDVVDGQKKTDIDKPVRKDRIESVQVGYAVDPCHIDPAAYSLIGLPPREYLLTVDGDQKDFLIKEGFENLLDGNKASIHSDRVLWVPGVWTPPNIRSQLSGSISRLALFWHHYKRYERLKAQAENIVARMEVLNVKRKNLNTIIAMGNQEEEQSIKKEAQNIANLMSSMGVAISDMENTEIEVISRKLADVEGIIKEARYSAIGASGGLTEIDIFGVSTLTGSLARADERDRMITADVVSAYQRAQWRKPLEKLLKLYFASSESKYNGIPEGFRIEFGTTFSSTPTETADLDLKKAQAAKAWIDAGGQPKQEKKEEDEKKAP